MNFSRVFSSLTFFLTLAICLSTSVSADIQFSTNEDGLYAVFSTDKGEFTAELYYDQTPITVANFVGLAEGSILRWDVTEKEPISDPYYEGITFHRVIRDFVIQGGSPNGLGTDGPGYSIPDEIVPDLVHDRAGLLSMAKSGPNSGGSQFFVTLGAAEWLNGIHTIFGEIVDGQDVVNTIGDLPTGANDKPTTPPVINEITILRIGADALAFDPREFDVPNVHFPAVELDLQGEQKVARFDRRINADYLLRHSTDLEDWETDESVLATFEAPAEHEIDITSSLEDEGKVFLEVTEVTSPYLIDAADTTLQINLDDLDALNISITGPSAGTYTYGDGEGTVTGYYWYPLEDRDQLHIGFSALRNMQLYFTWTDETSGTVFAHVLASSQFAQDQFSVEGTFQANRRPTEE